MPKEKMVKEDIQLDDHLRKLAQLMDKSCKILLSDKRVLAHILKATIKDFEKMRIRKIANKYIEGLTLVKNGLEHPKAKYIEGITNDQTTERFDVYFKVRLPGKKEIRNVFVNVEAQEDFHPGYAKIKRGIYYGAVMITNEYGTVFVHSNYDAIEKAYSIWLCLNPPKYLANTFTRYRIREEKIIGDYEEKEKNYDLLEVDMLNLGGRVNERYAGIFELLDCLLSKDEETKEERIRILNMKYDIHIDEDMKGAMEEMCTYGEWVAYDAIKKGMKKGEKIGKKIGKKIGEEKGVKETTLLFIRNLMESMGISAEEAMIKLQIPEVERGIFEALLKQ